MARQDTRSGEAGATFLTILVVLIVLAVALMMAVEPLSTVMQREKEEELVFRGEEICEAIRNYQKEHGGAFPPEMKELLKKGQNKVPYLRRLYKNPFDPEGKWHYIAPGSTTVLIKDDGSKEILPAGAAGQSLPAFGSAGQQGGFGSQPGGSQQPPKGKILPFNLEGKEGLPILGVYAKWHKPAFRKYLESNEISEWYFSPLVIQPKAPINLNPQPPPPKTDGPGGPAKPGGMDDD